MTLHAICEDAPNVRKIEMKITWAMAAPIYIAALENGTGKGKEAARAEIMRMAQTLDALAVDQTDTTIEGTVA